MPNLSVKNIIGPAEKPVKHSKLAGRIRKSRPPSTVQKLKKELHARRKEHAAKLRETHRDLKSLGWKGKAIIPGNK